MSSGVGAICRVKTLSISCDSGALDLHDGEAANRLYSMVMQNKPGLVLLRECTETRFAKIRKTFGSSYRGYYAAPQECHAYQTEGTGVLYNLEQFTCDAGEEAPPFYDRYIRQLMKFEHRATKKLVTVGLVVGSRRQSEEPEIYFSLDSSLLIYSFTRPEKGETTTQVAVSEDSGAHVLTKDQVEELSGLAIGPDKPEVWELEVLFS